MIKSLLNSRNDIRLYSVIIDIQHSHEGLQLEIVFVRAAPAFKHQFMTMCIEYKYCVHLRN